MESKFYNKDCIVLDGKMDEAVWETAEEYTGFRKFIGVGGGAPLAQTSFRILRCEDRIYVGVKCPEPYMQLTIAERNEHTLWSADCIELFLSPAGNSYEFYQFAISINNQVYSQYYSEAGAIRPDPYAPDWKRAVYIGEDYWSVEIELPLTAFYMTLNDDWSSEWLVNVCRTRVLHHSVGGKRENSSWSQVDLGYMEPTKFGKMDGFPMRPACNDLRISMVSVADFLQTEAGYCGAMTVRTVIPEPGVFEFSGEHAQTRTLELAKGENTFTVPCCFEELNRHTVAVQLKRLSDGEVFKRYYPVKVTYEAIKLRFTKPEFRTNFYPGQDYTKVEGRVVAVKPVTLKLEGPGIETQVVTPDTDGSFRFDTANMEIGEGLLTVSMEGYEITRKIRRLAPSKHMMTWISGGNLIVNGKPVLRRNMYAQYFRGGEAFNRRYDADDLHQTLELRAQKGAMQPGNLMPKLEAAGGEATKDVKPCDELFRKIDKILEDNKDNDFAYYYLSDEPECRDISPVYLKYLYDYITDKDPYHVVLMACRVGEVYAECTDWFEAHQYIEPQVREDRPRYYRRPFHTLGECIEKIVGMNRSDKCVGFIPTCFAYKFNNIYGDYPTFEEYISHTWAGMMAGGKTLFPYAYHDLNDRAALYEGTRYVFSSFEALEKFILFGKRTDLYRTQDARAVLYDIGNEKMFVLANFIQQPQRITLEGLTGQWHEFRHNRMITGNTFDLKPLEVVIGTTEVKDTGLPTYQEVFELVEKLEYERTHRGSLLFDRYLEIEVTGSKARCSRYKLFDGVQDNHAWESVGQMDKFLELGLTKINPTVKKVAVYGYPMEDVELKVRQGGELFVPEVAEIQTEEFSKIFVLKDAIKPEAIRLESKQERLEIYEIEAF